MSKNLKLVVVGDGGVGKTCILISYTSNNYPTVYIPTVFDSYLATVMVADEPHIVALFDTSGMENYSKLRPISYLDTDVFLLCFSVVIHTSVTNVKSKWVPEVTHHCPEIPFLLVGTQIDLRDDPEQLEKMAENDQSPLTMKQGEELAREVGAVKYVECSALTREGLKNIFDEATLAAKQLPEPVKRRMCTLL